jgi:hypothetical protein
MGYLSVAAGVLLTTIFGVSAIAKSRNMGEFTDSLYHLAPNGFVRWVAFLILATEVATLVALGTALVHSRMLIVGLVLSVFLLTGLSLGICLALVRRSKASCSCFGPNGGRLSIRHVIRNLFLVAVAVMGTFGRDQLLELEPAGIAATVLCAVVVALLVISMDDFIEVFH